VSISIALVEIVGIAIVLLNKTTSAERTSDEVSFATPGGSP